MGTSYTSASIPLPVDVATEETEDAVETLDVPPTPEVTAETVATVVGSSGSGHSFSPMSGATVPHATDII
jgi:hypothetical protein